DLLARIREHGRLSLLGKYEIDFDEDEDLVLHRRKSLPLHPNGMTFTAWGEGEEPLSSHTYYSVRGGFVIGEDASGSTRIVADSTSVPPPCTTGDQLLAICREAGVSMAQVMLQNELAWRSEEEVRSGLVHLWSVMSQCIDNGMSTEGVLPG